MKSITLTQLRRNPRKVRLLTQKYGEILITVRSKPGYVASKISSAVKHASDLTI